MGLQSIRACVVLGRETRPGGREMAVVFIQVIVEVILRMDHPGRAHGLTKKGPEYAGEYQHLRREWRKRSPKRISKNVVHRVLAETPSVLDSWLTTVDCSGCLLEDT